MNHSVNEPAIVVEGEDDRCVFGEECVEGHVIHAMRMIIGAINTVKSTTFTTRTLMQEHISAGAKRSRRFRWLVRRLRMPIRRPALHLRRSSQTSRSRPLVSNVRELRPCSATEAAAAFRR